MSFARVRALVVIGVLAVAALVFVVVALVRDTQGGAASGGECPPGAPTADLTLPSDMAEITVKVYNGTNREGVGDVVSTDFKNRRFKTEKPAKEKKVYDNVAVLRYGPDAVGKAQVLAAYFLGQAKSEYSPKRKGSVVDVVIGNGFQQLATTTEVNQSMMELGPPEVPPGACAGPAKKG